MKTLLMTTFAAILMSACGGLGAKTEPANTAANSTSAATAEAKMKTGDTVVARWSKNSYYEGTVEEMQASKAKIKWNDRSNPSDVDLVDIYPMPKAGTKPDVKVGDIVLAKNSNGTYWNGAEITSIDGDVYAVKLVEGGATANMPPEKIIKITPAAAADMKAKADSNDFLKDAQAKKPAIPGGYTPKVGEKVLGEWARNSWWSGKVTKVSGDKTTVAWDDGSKPAEVGEGKVLPLPSARNSEMPSKGQFVLAKPESGSKWVYAQVDDVADGNVKIKLSDGKDRTIKAGEFVLLN